MGLISIGGLIASSCTWTGRVTVEVCTDCGWFHLIAELYDTCTHPGEGRQSSTARASPLGIGRLA